MSIYNHPGIFIHEMMNKVLNGDDISLNEAEKLRAGMIRVYGSAPIRRRG